MNNVARVMDFNVYTDLKTKNEYNIKIDLENEVDADTREVAIILAGSVVRNNFKNLYGRTLDDEELSENIKEKLNTWIPENANFKALSVVAMPKKINKR